MLKKRSIIFAILCILTSGVFVVQAQTDRVSVLEYFRFTDEDPDIRVTLHDKKNGYLEMKGDEPPMLIYATIFRLSNDEVLLITSYESICSSISGCGSESYVYKIKKGGAIKNVTKEVLPTLSDRENAELFDKNKRNKGQEAKYISLKYRLPRKGKVIKVFGTNFGEEKLESNVKLYELHFKNGKFVIVR